MTRCTSRTQGFVFLLLAATLALPGIAQTLPPTFPGDAWEVKTPAELGMDEAKLAEAQAYALSRNGAGLIVRNGYQVAAWGKMTDRYPVFSVTKGIGAVLLGIARGNSLLQLSDTAKTHYADFGNLPVENAATGFVDSVTIEQLATHSAGFEKDSGAPRLKFQPGTRWVYSDGGANWLADVLTVRFGEDLKSVLEREVLSHLGITALVPSLSGDLAWRNVAASNPRGTTIGALDRREFNAGISINVDAMARIGLLLERDGTWNGTPIVPSDFIDRLSSPAPGIAGLPITDTGGAPDPKYPNATAHLGLFWWNNGDGTMQNVPTDAFWAWGLGDHLIVVIPSLQLVIARTSAQGTEGDARLQPNAWKAECQASMCAHYDALEPFLNPIVASVQGGPLPPGAPTVTLASDLPNVPVGGSAVLTWSSVLADSCTASGGWTGDKATAGTETVTVSETTTYTLACTGTGGTTETSVTVTADAATGAPTVTLTSNVGSVSVGGSAVLTWSSTLADACTASNGWTGAKAASGTETVTVSQTTTYTLSCTGTGGTTESSVSVTANAAPAPPPAPPPADNGGGGGGGMLQWWMLVGLLLGGGARRNLRSRMRTA